MTKIEVEVLGLLTILKVYAEHHQNSKKPEGKDYFSFLLFQSSKCKGSNSNFNFALSLSFSRKDSPSFS